MARSRRALSRKGNVASFAEAREKRDVERKAQAKTDAKTCISTLDEETRKLQDNVQQVSDLTLDKSEQAIETKPAKAGKKVSNRKFNREKVEAIKKSIADGSYQINHKRVADKFIERESVG